MRVAIVTQGSPLNGSAYFRALQYAPLLRKRGFQVVCVPARVATRRIGGRAGALTLLCEHAGRYALRSRELGRVLDESDAVIVQRGAYPVGPPLLLRGLRSFDGRLVYDLDDAVFVPTPTLAHRSRAARWAYKDRQSRVLLERADRVIVSTPELDDSLPGRRADLVLPTIPDVWAYPTVVHDDSSPLRLGWIGSQGNVRYLDPLREVLTRLAHEGVARLEVVANAPWDGPASFRRWERASEASAVSRFEVGLMPLPDSPYTQAKAGFKLLQYMAAGCAVVASPVGMNRELLERSASGLLASTQKEWQSAVCALASDTPRRAEYGANAQCFVREFADRERHCDALAAVLRGEKPPPVPTMR